MHPFVAIRVQFGAYLAVLLAALQDGGDVGETGFVSTGKDDGDDDAVNGGRLTENYAD